MAEWWKKLYLKTPAVCNNDPRQAKLMLMNTVILHPHTELHTSTVLLKCPPPMMYKFTFHDESVIRGIKGESM